MPHLLQGSHGPTVTRTAPLLWNGSGKSGPASRSSITVHNYSQEPAECLIVLEIGADYADLFEVKEARIRRRWEETREADDGMLTIRGNWQDVRKGTAIHVPGAGISGNTVQYRVSVPAHGQWSTVLTVLLTGDGVQAPAFAHSEGDSLSPRDRRRREWVAKIPVLEVANRSVERTLRRSHDDLGALRIEDPDHPERVVVAAGAPWFMALFGRDSLWAS